jgi:hypothetical protein
LLAEVIANGATTDAEVVVLRRALAAVVGPSHALAWHAGLPCRWRHLYAQGV